MVTAPVRPQCKAVHGNNVWRFLSHPSIRLHQDDVTISRRGRWIGLCRTGGKVAWLYGITSICGDMDRFNLKMNSSKFCCVFSVNTKSLLSLGWWNIWTISLCEFKGIYISKYFQNIVIGKWLQIQLYTSYINKLFLVSNPAFSFPV